MSKYKHSPIKQTMIHEIAEQIMEYMEKRDEVSYIDDMKRFNYYEGKIEAIYTLAKRFDIWNFEIHEYIRDIVREMDKEDIKKKRYLRYFVDETV